MDWQFIAPFDSDNKIEEVQIEIKSEKDEREELTELIKAEIDVKFETYEQEENGTVRNENIEIKIEENEQESLEHLKELSESHEDEEVKNHTLLTEIISKVQINTLRSNSSQNPWKCCLCHSACKDKFDLREHITATHKDPSNSNLFKCDLCSYITEYLHKLVMHKAQHKSHTDVLHHQFEALDAVTEQKSNVENKKQKCGACDFKYENEINLREHITATHKDPFNSNMFKCNICDYLTKYFHRLTLHMSSHDSSSNTNWYFCDKCTYRSRHTEYLKQHNLRHLSVSDSDLYKCSKCSFRSKSHGVLLRHLLAHKKQYQCEMCDYKTIHKWRIKMHVVKHKELSEVKVYKCILCDFRTKWTTSFNKHLSRHDIKLS
ncbi:zinc finger autosomal protein-like [Anoplophora glabripennis]|uniref:zinc finger autosomal protein-like n=1 Tax=Anoplophora glabripennis TaxID=217634 RepID=UPI000873DD62|nr:zinc finger autosomal protein-like [Anoplophora glabripennis]